MGYYKNFIRGYAQITTPLEKLLKKEVKFQWNEECQQSLDTLKKKMVTAPILVFPYWKKEFHVHIDASSIVRHNSISTRGRRFGSSHCIFQQKVVDY
jgi:hypothetical protein